MSDSLKVIPTPQSVKAPSPSKGKEKQEKASTDQVSQLAQDIPVTYTPSESKSPTTYSKNGSLINQSKLDALKADAEEHYASLIAAVKAMIERQGLDYESVLEKIKSSKESGEEVLIEVDQEMRDEAQAAIAEDGYYGVKQTSERIIDFAITISGEDKSKFDLLVDAIKNGFEAAKEAFGGELPEISQKTYDAVMEGLEAWKNGDEALLEQEENE